MRAYLAGAMDRVPDGGVGWRAKLGEWLTTRHGVIVMDPCRKPIDIGAEDIESRERRKQQKLAEDYEAIREDMKEIRGVDLGMVDIADFLVVNLDLDVHACGTYEELFWANRCKKPVIVHVEQGKQSCPDWLFGTLPIEHIFGAWHSVYHYLDSVADGRRSPTDKRWRFFHDIIHRKIRRAA
jgi:hypothetical protein